MPEDSDSDDELPQSVDAIFDKLENNPVALREKIKRSLGSLQHLNKNVANGTQKLKMFISALDEQEIEITDNFRKIIQSLHHEISKIESKHRSLIVALNAINRAKNSKTEPAGLEVVQKFYLGLTVDPSFAPKSDKEFCLYNMALFHHACVEGDLSTELYAHLIKSKREQISLYMDMSLYTTLSGKETSDDPLYEMSPCYIGVLIHEKVKNDPNYKVWETRGLRQLRAIKAEMQRITTKQALLARKLTVSLTQSEIDAVNEELGLPKIPTETETDAKKQEISDIAARKILGNPLDIRIYKLSPAEIELIKLAAKESPRERLAKALARHERDALSRAISTALAPDDREKPPKIEALRNAEQMLIGFFNTNNRGLITISLLELMQASIEEKLVSPEKIQESREIAIKEIVTQGSSAIAKLEKTIKNHNAHERAAIFPEFLDNMTKALDELNKTSILEKKPILASDEEIIEQYLFRIQIQLNEIKEKEQSKEEKKNKSEMPSLSQYDICKKAYEELKKKLTTPRNSRLSDNGFLIKKIPVDNINFNPNDLLIKKQKNIFHTESKKQKTEKTPALAQKEKPDNIFTPDYILRKPQSNIFLEKSKEKEKRASLQHSASSIAMQLG